MNENLINRKKTHKDLWGDLYYMALKSGWAMRINHMGDDTYKLWFYRSEGWTEGMGDPIGYQIAPGTIEGLAWDISKTVKDNWQ